MQASCVTFKNFPHASVALASPSLLPEIFSLVPHLVPHLLLGLPLSGSFVPSPFIHSFTQLFVSISMDSDSYFILWVRGVFKIGKQPP